MIRRRERRIRRKRSHTIMSLGGMCTVEAASCLDAAASFARAKLVSGEWDGSGILQVSVMPGSCPSWVYFAPWENYGFEVVGGARSADPAIAHPAS